MMNTSTKPLLSPVEIDTLFAEITLPLLPAGPDSAKVWGQCGYCGQENSTGATDCGAQDAGHIKWRNGG